MRQQLRRASSSSQAKLVATVVIHKERSLWPHKDYNGSKRLGKGVMMVGCSSGGPIAIQMLGNTVA
ncbi:hypothetical protein ACMD2_15111, partial [Ananas comosus]